MICIGLAFRLRSGDGSPIFKPEFNIEVGLIGLNAKQSVLPLVDCLASGGRFYGRGRPDCCVPRAVVPILREADDRFLPASRPGGRGGERHKRGADRPRGGKVDAGIQLVHCTATGMVTVRLTPLFRFISWVAPAYLASCARIDTVVNERVSILLVQAPQPRPLPSGRRQN